MLLLVEVVTVSALALTIYCQETIMTNLISWKDIANPHAAQEIEKKIFQYTLITLA